MGSGMVLMVWPCKCEEDIHIQQCRLHGVSSESRSEARFDGMIGAFGGTRKLGKPDAVVEMEADFSPRRAKVDSTCPSCWLDASAKALAASKTSSSKVTVVRMR